MMLLCCSLLSALVHAQNLPLPAPPQLAARSYILIDADSGVVLAEQNADTRVDPASITKLMTAYVVFHELRKGALSLNDVITVSQKAWETGGSRMFIEVGKQVTIEELLKGMIIQSGNDASVALAEHIAGSTDVFPSIMNKYADELGLENTNYMNSNGLTVENHYSSARDIAKLSNAIINEFPEYYRWYSEKEFTYNGIRQHNRNNLLWRDPAVDGLKTGYTDAAGYCLASSANRADMRLISVVMGTDSEKSRADESQKLLNYGFRFYETHKLFESGQALTVAKLWKGDKDTLALGINQDLYITIPRGQYDNLQARIETRRVMTAPIENQTEVGRLRILLDDEEFSSTPIFTLEGAGEGGFWHRFSDSISLWFYDDE